VCVAAIAWQAHPRWRLIAIANRDEFHDRPSAPLARWADREIVAGRDLRAGGTWLGVTDTGRFALVTNYRAEGYPQPELASRGALVTDWLHGTAPSADPAMNPFNLFTADTENAWFTSNLPGFARCELPFGIHSLTNGAFAQPWPKSLRLAAGLQSWIDGPANDPHLLFAPLADAELLGGTGPDPEFSGVFIRNPDYGTRCSTVTAIAHDGTGLIAERRFAADGSAAGETVIILPG
jgi:uncharacterized protein with NRDE domain